MSDYVSIAMQADVVLSDLVDGDDQFYYAIIQGNEPGIVRGWANAAQRTIGSSSVVIEKCLTRGEAEQVFAAGIVEPANRTEDSEARCYESYPLACTPSVDGMNDHSFAPPHAPASDTVVPCTDTPTAPRSFDTVTAAANGHLVENILYGTTAPAPPDPIPGFPTLRPPPLPIDDAEPDRAIPPAAPFLSATARAVVRDPDNVTLQESDFSPRSRLMFQAADQRSERSVSPMTIYSGSSGLSDAARDDTYSIGADTDFGVESDEEDVLGDSAVLPPADTVTGTIEVEATIPRSDRPQSAGPYIVQLQLPRDYVKAGIDIETRIRVDNVSQVTVTACGPTVNGVFNVGREKQREDERYLKYRDGQRMNDFVRYHLNAAVAFSMAIPLNESYDPAYMRVINDMSVVLADVLLGGYAYYAIIRGRRSGLYRGTWFNIKGLVENDPRSFYQAFREGKAARRWFRHHQQFRLDFDKVPLPGTENVATPGPAPLIPIQGGSGSSTM